MPSVTAWLRGFILFVMRLSLTAQIGVWDGEFGSNPDQLSGIIGCDVKPIPAKLT